MAPVDGVDDLPFDPAVDRPIEEFEPDLLSMARSAAWTAMRKLGTGSTLDFDDLLGAAYEGWMQAASRWPSYCAEHRYSPDLTRFYKVYCSRRMKGAILDVLRREDRLNRRLRDHYRQLQAAGVGTGLSDDQLAEATGLTAAEVREALAAEAAARPVRMDAEVGESGELTWQDQWADAGADVEGSVVASELLGQAVALLQRMPLPTQLAVALVVYHGLDPKRAGAMLGLDGDEVQGMVVEASLAVHQALVEAAGGPVVRKPPPEVPVVTVFEQDGGTGTDRVGTKLCRDCGRDRPTPEFVIRRMSRDGLGIYCRPCIRDQRETRKGQTLRGSRPRVDPGRAAAIRELREAGTPFAEIAAKTGVSAGSCWRLAQG